MDTSDTLGKQALYWAATEDYFYIRLTIISKMQIFLVYFIGTCCNVYVKELCLKKMVQDRIKK